MKPAHALTRRQLLIGGGAAVGLAALDACTSAAPARAAEVGPTSPAVAAAESRRRVAGARTVEAALLARPARIDLGGPVVTTWANGDTVPGRLPRARIGDVLKVSVRNGLPQDTSVHWHGVALRNDLRATEAVRLPAKTPDRTHDLLLGGDMAGYRWRINGRTYDRSLPLPVRAGEAVRVRFVNQTMMFHPMHVHGHIFHVRTKSGQDGPRKDTVMVRPDETVSADLIADNPGQWPTATTSTTRRPA